MAHLKFAVAVVAGLVALPSHALYVTPSTPANWLVQSGQAMYQASTADISFANGIRSKIGASIALAGGAAEIPVAFKFAAMAGKVAASVAFGWPGVFLAVGGLAYSYFTSNKLEVETTPDGSSWKKRVDYFESGTLYTYKEVGTGWFASPGPACEAYYGAFTGDKAFWKYHYLGTGDFPKCILATNAGGVGGYTDPHNLLTKVGEVPRSRLDPVLRPEFETLMDGKPVPLGVPQAWPQSVPMWWPVERPIVSPSPANPADPQAVPVPVPFRVPQGEPIPVVPATDPATWVTPVIDIVPSPTTDNPWRVDVQPKELTSTSSEPLPSAVVPATPASGTTATSKPQEQIDFCVAHPEILACAKPNLDTPESTDLSTVERIINFVPNGGWGGGAGSCPAPRHLAGANVDFKFDMFCDFMSGVKPVLLAIAGLVSAMILIGARGGAAE